MQHNPHIRHNRFIHCQSYYNRYSESISVTVAPTVNFTSSPATPSTGQSVTFTATTSGGAGPFTFSWNYGDGSPDDNGSLAAHTYAAPGSFMVSLTTKDANGASVVT